jgi:4-hydroxythreonine-4-phosphate dehydrogenase
MQGRQNKKPFLALTLGDPAGVGPWVSVLAARHPAIRARSRPVLIGDAWVLHKFFPSQKLRIHALWDLDSYVDKPGAVNILHVPHPEIRKLALGRPQKTGGESAALAVRVAVGLAMQKRVAAIVTAPVSKESLNLAGLPYPGHTELLAKLSGAQRADMVMAGPLSGLKKNQHPPLAVLLTRHLPLMQVARNISPAMIADALKFLDPWVTWILGGKKKPRWAVCGLNPHAGDNGLIGWEDKKIVFPAVQKLSAKKISVAGPLPADVAWGKTAQGQFDAVACLYHDQGLIALKSLYPRGVVNITAGLPFVRTSPAHGTAFDLAAGPKPYASADPTSTLEAALWALKLSQ